MSPGNTMRVPTGSLAVAHGDGRSEEHTSELQSPCNLVCRLLLEKKKDGHKVGWVSQKLIAKNKISVDQDGSSVHNNNYRFETKNEINYDTERRCAADNHPKLSVS